MNMIITPDQSNEIYARFLFARYGVDATGVASETLDKMTAINDRSGIAAWSGVLEKVKGLLSQNPAGQSLYQGQTANG